MNEVVDDVDVPERRDQRSGVTKIAPRHLYLAAPRCVVELCGIARQSADGVTVL
jgi:hypothetical protein